MRKMSPGREFNRREWLQKIKEKVLTQGSVKIPPLKPNGISFADLDHAMPVGVKCQIVPDGIIIAKVKHIEPTIQSDTIVS